MFYFNLLWFDGIPVLCVCVQPKGNMDSVSKCPCQREEHFVVIVNKTTTATTPKNVQNKTRQTEA